MSRPLMMCSPIAADETVRAYLRERMQDVDAERFDAAQGFRVGDLDVMLCGPCGRIHEFFEIVNEDGRRIGMMPVVVNRVRPEPCVECGHRVTDHAIDEHGGRAECEHYPCQCAEFEAE